MEPDEATDLAYTLGNRWQEGRDSREQAAELAKLCGYLPLPVSKSQQRAWAKRSF